MAEQNTEKPHEIVKQQIEDLYLQISTIRRGEICIYPDLARHLDGISKEVSKLLDESLTINPDSILEGRHNDRT